MTSLLAFAALLACSGILVGKDASTTGRVLWGHNEDDGGVTVVRHHLVPARDWPAGAVLRREPDRAAIPQVPHTLAYFWSEVPEACAADAFYNECGVVIASDNGGRTRDVASPLTDGGVVLGLRHAVAERAHTAREGVAIAASVVETYGYFHPGRIYLIADKDEAWAFHAVHGRHWAAQRCPDDAVAFVPNHFTIGELPEKPTADSLFPSDLRDFAEKNGWWTRGKPFDFAKVFQDPTWRGIPHNVNRSRYVLGILTGRSWTGREFPFSAKPAKKLSPADLRRILTSHPAGEPCHTNDFESATVCRRSTIESLVCEFAAEPSETTLHLAKSHPCERGYTAFRPFKDRIPE